MPQRLFRLFAASLFWIFSNASANELVIGQCAPLSGSLASTGREMALGAKVYFDAVNAEGGIGGRRIRHVVKDDGYKTEETLRLTQELIDKDRAVGLIGYAGTGNISELLARGVLAARNVPLVAPYTGGEPLRKPYNPHIFHIRAGYAEEVERMVEQFTGVGLNRIAVFYQNDAFGQAGLAAAESALARRKLSLAGKGSYEKGSEDVAAAVDSIAKASPQAVLMISVMRPAAAFVRQFRKLNPGAQIFSISVINGKDFFSLAGADVARGVGITQVVPSPSSGAHKVAQEYREAMRKYAPDIPPSYTSFEMYLGAKVVVEGLRRVKGEPTPEALSRALEGLDTDLGGYPVRFGAGNRIGSNFVEVTLLRNDGSLGK